MKNIVEKIVEKTLDGFDIKKIDKKAKSYFETMNLFQYLNRIKNGEYKVPLFQRDFVWKSDNVLDFLNSLLKGYPIGNFTVWKKDNLADPEKNKILDNFIKDYSEFPDAHIEIEEDEEQEVEKHSIKNTEKEKNQKWILDGQQRTTCLIGTLISYSRNRKFKNIIFSFKEKEFKFLDSNVDDEKNFIYAYEIFDIYKYENEHFKKYSLDIKFWNQIEKLRQIIFSSKISIIEISTENIDTVIDIYTKMNTKGKKLSLFDIVYSKWLVTNININLKDYWETKLNELNFKPELDTMIKCIYVCVNKGYENVIISGSEIMQYDLNQIRNIKEFLDTDCLAVFQKTSDYIANTLKWKQELMPSENIFKFLFYAFYYNNKKNKEFNFDCSKLLAKYVKVICLNNIYRSSTNEKLKKNIEFIDDLLKLDNNDKSISKEYIENKYIKSYKNHIDKDEILNISYGDNSSAYYLILNYLFQNARSLSNNAEIANVTNANDKITNIHHLIPKAAKFNDPNINKMDIFNSIANLLPILDSENKSIGSKMPVDYIKTYSQNIELKEMFTNCGVDWDYFKKINNESDAEGIRIFLKLRATNLSKLLNDWINK